jgi:ligand-binding SRPBCC domain-containing protein
MDRPSKFVNAQVKGPFKAWRHLHLFEAESDGTRMTDRISYEALLGIIGRTVDRLFLRRYLTALIAERSDFLKNAAESS